MLQLGELVYYKPFPKREIAAPVIEGSKIERCPAIITMIHSQELVNLAVFDANGGVNPETSVTYVPEGRTPERSHGYCEPASVVLDMTDLVDNDVPPPAEATEEPADDDTTPFDDDADDE